MWQKTGILITVESSRCHFCNLENTIINPGIFTFLTSEHNRNWWKIGKHFWLCYEKWLCFYILKIRCVRLPNQVSKIYKLQYNTLPGHRNLMLTYKTWKSHGKLVGNIFNTLWFSRFKKWHISYCIMHYYSLSFLLIFLPYVHYIYVM